MSDKAFEDVAAFLARGGQIKRLPPAAPDDVVFVRTPRRLMVPKAFEQPHDLQFDPRLPNDLRRR